VTLSLSTIYDFSTSASQAFGSNQKVLDTGVYGIFSGDVNNDSVIDFLDQVTVDNDVAIFAGGYILSDLNGDGVTDFLDQLIMDNNVALFVSSILPRRLTNSPVSYINSEHLQS